MNSDDQSGRQLERADSIVKNALAQGVTLLQEKAPERVIEILRPITNQNVKARDLNCILALALFQLNRFEEGVNALNQELTNFPDNAGAQDLMSRIRAAITAADSGRGATVEAAAPSAPPQTIQSVGSSELDQIIQPEILNDEFYEIILELAERESLTHVLEIGSSSGAGSTRAFVTGLSKNPGRPTLHCLEVSKPRFEVLSKSLAVYPFVRCRNASSVPVESFPSPEEVRSFYSSVPTALNNYPIERVLGWLAQDIDYIRSSGAPTNGIAELKRELRIKTFDLVLIDGSEFTGSAEMQEVYGSRWILLDDVRGFKNFNNYKLLKQDPHYEVWRENLSVRNGFAVFKRVKEIAPIHFFTIVLNGMPFITHHIEEMRKLRVPWHWHIVEGLAELKYDTGWSLPTGGTIPVGFDQQGLSIDGTSAYLDQLGSLYPENISIYRKPRGTRWQGKIEMVSAPLAHIRSSGLLWQIDSDELWTAETIHAMHQLFAQHPQRHGAYVHCDYFVGPTKYVSSVDSWATGSTDWLRVWRYQPGFKWGAHEPPVLLDTDGCNVASHNPFTRDETKAAGLTFQHFSYATPEQVKFKESYYGYSDAFQRWKELQKTTGPIDPSQYLPWAKRAVVEDWTAAQGQSLGERFFRGVSGPTDYRSMSTHGGGRFEAELRKLFAHIRPRKIIETGTYKGQGTTSIIWRALRDFNIVNDFATIEVNPVNHREANQYFQQHQMQLASHLGLSLPRNLLPSIEKIREEFVIHKQFSGIYYDHEEQSRDQLYFAETNFEVPDNLLYSVLQSQQFAPDFVLLDSAGHLGFAEFEFLIAHLRAPCFIMLDDIYHCKHFKSLQVIKRDPRFTLLVECPEKFGFCIAFFTPNTEGIRRRELEVASGSEVRSIVLLRTDSIGDAILSSCLLEPIARRYPAAQITVLCREHIAELYQSSPYVHNVITVDYHRIGSNQSYLAQIIQQVQALNADMLINSLFSREVVTEYIAATCGARERIALRGDSSNIQPDVLQKGNPFYTRVIETAPELCGELQRHRELLAGLGVPVAELKPMIWLTEEDHQVADAVFRELGIDPQKTICVAPGTQWEFKNYPNFGHALTSASELTDYSFLALGSSSEANLCGDLVTCVEGRGRSLAGRLTIRQSAAVIQRARFLVGCDSSLAHIACAVGTPNLVVLGGGHFGRFFPYSSLTSVVCFPLECFNCNWQCKFNRVHCVKDISPQSIRAALVHSLQSSSSVARIFVQSSSPAPHGSRAVAIDLARFGLPSDCEVIPV